MSVSLRFSVEKPHLLCQEDSSCELALTNHGGHAVSWRSPEQRPALYRVFDLGSQRERICRKPSWEDAKGPERTLDPGETAEATLSLLEEIGELPPGEHEISAIYEIDAGADRVESAPVRVKVRPWSPRYLLLDTLQGADAYGVWVSVEEQPRIVRGRFSFWNGARVDTMSPVAPCTLHARPVLSLPRNRENRETHWIAWLEEGQLCFAHIDGDLACSPVVKTRLPDLDAEIVAPLHSDPLRDTTVRPAGAALLWLGNREGTMSRFQSVPLLPGPFPDGPCIDLRGGRPKWMASHELSNGKRFVTFLQRTGEKQTLLETPWPGSGSPRPLGEWPGRFLAAGATLDLDDAVRGGHLLRDSEKLQLIRWDIDPHDRFEEVGRIELGWDSDIPILQAVLRVSGAGIPAALLQDDRGKWFGYDGKLRPLAVGRGQWPLDIAFLADGTPLAIHAEAKRGFRLLRMDAE